MILRIFPLGLANKPEAAGQTFHNKKHPSFILVLALFLSSSTHTHTLTSKATQFAFQTTQETPETLAKHKQQQQNNKADDCLLLLFLLLLNPEQNVFSSTKN